jgi:hypothetical protein
MNSVAKPLNIADFRWARRRLPAAWGRRPHRARHDRVGETRGDGSPDDAFYRMAMAQMRPGLVGRGLLSDTEYAVGIALLDDPTIIDTVFANVVAWGRRPPP